MACHSREEGEEHSLASAADTGYSSVEVEARASQVGPSSAASRAGCHKLFQEGTHWVVDRVEVAACQCSGPEEVIGVEGVGDSEDEIVTTEKAGEVADQGYIAGVENP